MIQIRHRSCLYDIETLDDFVHLLHFNSDLETHEHYIKVCIKPVGWNYTHEVRLNGDDYIKLNDKIYTVTDIGENFDKIKALVMHDLEIQAIDAL